MVFSHGMNAAARPWLQPSAALDTMSQLSRVPIGCRACATRRPMSRERHSRTTTASSTQPASSGQGTWWTSSSATSTTAARIGQRSCRCCAWKKSRRRTSMSWRWSSAGCAAQESAS
ncbi:MAG: hypothetical protein U1F67_21560 [Rubrivivax sp.]